MAAVSKRQLAAAGLRVSGDYRAEKIGAKIRAAQLELVPYMFVVGPREVAEGKVAVRDRIEGDLARCRWQRPSRGCRQRSGIRPCGGSSAQWSVAGGPLLFAVSFLLMFKSVFVSPVRP